MALVRPTKLPDVEIPKAELARIVARLVRESGMTQAEVAAAVDDAQSQLSLVVRGKLAGFSTARLLRMITRLGRDIHIVVRPAKKTAGKVRVVQQGKG